MSLSRRTLLMLLGAAGTAGCQFYADIPPVVIGGATVSPDQPIMAALRASADHKRFTAALEAAGLDQLLQGIGPLTVFAPIDRAFDMLRPKTAKARIESDPGALEQVLLGHIVQARVTGEDLLNAFPQLNGKTKIFSMNGQVIRVQGDPQQPRLLDLRKRPSKVLIPDAIASNGIIHVVDELLLPAREAFDAP